MAVWDDIREFAAEITADITGQFTIPVSSGSLERVVRAADSPRKQTFHGVETKLVGIRYYDEKHQADSTGILISGDGFILTSRHGVSAVKEKTLPAYVKYKGRTYSISSDSVWYPRSIDMAIIKIPLDYTIQSPVVRTTPLSLGEEVRVLGMRDEAAYRTIGVVEAPIFGPPFKDKSQYYMRVDARCLEGESGGAIVDSNARIVGIAVGGGMSSLEKVSRTTIGVRGYTIIEFLKRLSIKLEGH